MRDEEQRPRIAREPLLEPHHRVQVEVVGRLVEEQQVRAGHQRLREVQAHAPAAGEACHGVRVPRVREAEPGEQRRGTRARRVAVDGLEAMVKIGDRVPVGRVVLLGLAQRALDGAELRVAVHHELDRRRRDGRGFLRDVRDRPAGRHRDVARLRVELAAQQREQRRLAAAVRADDADLVADVDGERRVLDQPVRAAGERDVVEAEHRLSLRCRSRSR